MSAQAEGRGLIHKGDKTTTGGVVTSGVGNVMFVGEGVTQTGMVATCPSCKKGQGKITPLKPIPVIVDGVQAALHGDIVACGCPYGANTLIASPGAMSFSKGSDGNIRGFKPHASNLDMEASYQAMADSVGGRYAGAPPSSATQQAYAFTEKEWNDDLQKQAKEYKWDTSQQENVSIALLTVEEGNEYLDLLIKDTHGQLSTGKDYTGVGMGLKGAYEVAKELGGWGATAKAVNINGVMNIVIENYKPRYLDLGIRWQEATPQMLKIGHALNTVQGNISFLRGNIFVELVFSGAVNAVDYMLHDEKTLGGVVGQFTADISKGVVAGVIAQGFTLTLRAGFIFFAVTPPMAILLGAFAISAFLVGSKISELDNKFRFTEPMKKEIERLIDEN
ncbi:PAAR domain-containing protein [Vibrio crassostreae]|uniref:PAAR domain-containing protein n=1 Tax=Vibrio crassostreae TaxID=246167 RepID=UPI0010E73782|nr:PAAR domain-containing protein [Vibrio crassostreae]TCT66762.1 putative Zn-binding protein involved in type VI secretion [Vibrio crassostreae]